NQNALAEDIGRSCELLVPQTIADQNYVRRSIDIFRVCQISADLRFQSEHGEKFCTRASAAYTFGRTNARTLREIEILAANKRELAETPLRRVPIEPVHVTDRAPLEIVRALANNNDLVRIRIRQRPEQDRIHHAEDGGIGADAERERENRNEGEGRMLQQLPKRESK